MIRISKKHPRYTSDELQKELSTAEIDVSSSTIRRRLLKKGSKARRPLKKQLLTNTMKEKRLNWALEHQDMTAEDWRKVLFSDESHFYVQGQRSQYVRRSDGEELKPCHIQQYVKHPEKQMFWGCFSYHGVGQLRPITGMMNSTKYIEILQKSVLPTLNSMAEDNPIFQQDLAPCHTSKICKAFFENNVIRVLKWPGNSPDINPIENLWSIIKQRLRKCDCTTKSKLIQAIIQLWYHDTKIQENCQNLINSMPRRVQSLIKNNGGHIKY